MCPPSSQHLSRHAYLSDHHVAVKGALAKSIGGPVDMGADLGDNGSSKGNVGHKVTVHDIDMQPVCALPDGVGACFA